MKRAPFPPRRGGTPPAGNPGDRRPAPRREPQGDARATAAWVVERTLASLAPVDGFLTSALERFDERDQGFLRELVFGTLRWLRRLDAIVAQAANRPLAQIEPALLAPLRVGAYQLLLLDRVPAHAVVDEAVTLAGQLTHRGGASFVNAVLRRIARSPSLAEWPVAETDPVARLALELAHPEFLVRRWWQQFGEAETRALLAANNRAKPIHLMAFRDRGGRELLAESLIDAGVEVEPSRWSPLGLIVRAGSVFATEPFRRGDLYVQDEAGQAAALLLAPRPGERVLDAAAAPGGKGLALLAAEPSLGLVAADVAVDRLDRLRKNYRRLGRRIPIVAADAGAPGFGNERFDRVIVDLPCTGTGTLRKHPELKWRVSEGEIGRLANLGRRLLSGSAQLVVPGGYLQAITCSLEKEENEVVGDAFLAAHPEFERAGLEERVQPPLDRWVTGPGLWRMLTAEDHDGFTVQVFRRRGSAR